MRQLEVVGRVTRGTVVDVLLARHVQTHEKVVVEALRSDVKMSPEIVRRLHAQFELRKALEHPNLVHRAGEFYTVQKRHCWYSEQFRGEPLRHRLAQNRNLALPDLVRFSISLADALAYLHERDLIHGCLSPEYIVCDTDRSPMTAKIVDSSLSLLRVDSRRLVTSPRTLVRSEYLAPERIGGQRCTRASDLYSLGVVMFELAALTPPFHADDDELVRKMHLVEPPPKLPGGCKSLQLIVHRLLAKDPNKRFPSAAAVRDDLLEIEAAMKGTPRAPRMATAIPPGMRPKPPPLPPAKPVPAVQELAKAALPVVSIGYRNRWLALSQARADGAEITLHVPALAPTAPGEEVEVHCTIDDLAREFVLTGRVSTLIPTMTGRNGGFIVAFEGAQKRPVMAMLALCAARPAAMGTATAERVRVRLKASLSTGVFSRPAEIRDLSKTGAFVQARSLKGVELGTEVKLQVAPRFGFGGWVTARVIWRGDKDGLAGIGVRFVGVEPHVAERIRKLISAAPRPAA